jgi:hypothetical protein
VKQIRRHFTYANVMSSVAVFLILGGATAIAATKIGANQLKANSVKTGKIVKEAVTAGKIRNGAVTESKIADGAVTTNKIANDAVTGDKVKESTLSQVPSAATANSVATSAAGVALAGVTVSSAGTVLSWFNRLGGKPSVSHTAASGLYDITLPGIVIDTDGDDFVQQASIKGATFGGEIRVSGLTPAARIRTANSAGTATDSGFSYVVFDAAP